LPSKKKPPVLPLSGNVAAHTIPFAPSSTGRLRIHYNVMSRVMDMNEADILAGRANSVSARHYALYELDRLTDAYHHGWQKLGIVISDMLI